MWGVSVIRLGSGGPPPNRVDTFPSPELREDLMRMDFGMAQKTATVFSTRMLSPAYRDFRTSGHRPERSMHATPGFLATGS